MSKVNQSELLMQKLTEVQPQLYSFILSLLPNAEAASDVLQETNLVLWRKADEFVPGLNFLTWACRVAHFQVLAHRRDFHRDKHLFNDELLSEIADEAESHIKNQDARLVHLEKCLRKLPDRDRALIDARYASGSSVQAIGEQLHKTANAISRTLYRIRLSLMTCVEQYQHQEGAS